MILKIHFIFSTEVSWNHRHWIKFFKLMLLPLEVTFFKTTASTSFLYLWGIFTLTCAPGCTPWWGFKSSFPKPGPCTGRTLLAVVTQLFASCSLDLHCHKHPCNHMQVTHAMHSSSKRSSSEAAEASEEWYRTAKPVLNREKKAGIRVAKSVSSFGFVLQKQVLV